MSRLLTEAEVDRDDRVAAESAIKAAEQRAAAAEAELARLRAEAARRPPASEWSRY